MLIQKTKALFHPNMYHGWSKTNSYFEGWYFKLISKDEKHAYAIIPGVAMDEKGGKQAFIQILDGKNLKADYIKFDFNSFKASKDKFEVSIENNRFSIDQLSVDLPEVKGNLHFTNHFPWPSSWYSPGIMGPFSFVPFMECYHGILSLNNEIKGSLEIKGQKIDFEEGRAYMEKDWGRSFPEAYTWMQSNHFEVDGISFKASVAKIPWMGTSFVGFIAGFLINKELIQFTTYNFSRLKYCCIDEKKVELRIESPKYKLELFAEREDSTSLASPIQGFMDGRIEESMTAVLQLKVTNKRSGKVLFEGNGRNAGLDVGGDIKQILKL